MNQLHQDQSVNNVEVLLPSDPIKTNAAFLPSASSRSPLDLPVELFTQALDRREVNRKALLRWIASNLKQGVDFGRIHVAGKEKCPLAAEGNADQCQNPRHWSKPSLWKPGAEKICGMLGLIPRFPNLNEYERAVMRGDELKMILIKCELHTPAGFVAAEGTGARKLAQDGGDINKSLKMTEKSAHIDATLRVAGLSEIFTQDIEDMMLGSGNADTHSQASQRTQSHATAAPSAPTEKQESPSPSQSNPPAAERRSNGGQRLSNKQFGYIMNLAREKGIDKEALNRRCIEAYGVAVEYLSRSDASSLIELLLHT